MIYKKEYTVKEWKGFCKTIHEGEKIGNDMQYFNHKTQRMESFDYITTAEILCQRYEIILTDYKTKKEKFNEALDKFSFKNLDKTLTKVSRGIDQFSKTFEAPKKKRF